MDNQVGFQRLVVWQKADQLALTIYRLTSTFPKTEIFALTSQLRRAALSVATNIVEGYARNSKTECRRFLVIALGSLAETKYLLSVALRLRYLQERDYKEVMLPADEVGRMLWKFYRTK